MQFGINDGHFVCVPGEGPWVAGLGLRKRNVRQSGSLGHLFVWRRVPNSNCGRENRRWARVLSSPVLTPRSRTLDGTVTRVGIV